MKCWGCANQSTGFARPEHAQREATRAVRYTGGDRGLESTVEMCDFHASLVHKAQGVRVLSDKPLGDPS